MNGRLFLGALILFILGFAQPVLAATEVSGVIEGDTVWTAAESPFLVTETVYFSANEPGATLTVEPGVIIEFTNNSDLNIFGNLSVNGTSENPVEFTSSGDKDWQVNIFDSTENELDYLNLSSSDMGLYFFNADVAASNINISEGDGGFFAQDSEVTINNLIVESGDVLLIDSNTTASTVTVTSGDMLVDGNQISLNGYASQGGFIGFFNVDANIGGISLSNTASGPAFLIGNSSVSGQGVNIHDASMGLEIYGDSNVTLNNVETSNIMSGQAMYVTDSEIDISSSVFDGGVSEGINIGGGSSASMNDITVSNFAAPGIIMSGNSFTGSGLQVYHNLLGFLNYSSTIIDDSKIENNTIIGVAHAGEGSFEISNSLISENGVAGADSSGIIPLDASGNYWGDPSGPQHETLNPNGLGNAALGNTLIEPWLFDYCESECNSNIMFLPGIMSSRLYDGNEQLWEPGLFMPDAEFEALYLDEEGQSINPDIHTKDVLDNGYAYGKFVEDLTEIKAAGTINDFEAVAYDWRLAMEEVLSTGTEQEDGTIIYGQTETDPYIEKTLRRLAANSKSGKVTIVAHSNGGLVTKALINKLGDESADLIDQIIFVGVPQLGTPQAIGSLLHGYNAGLPEFYPFVLSPERARDLAINMPMIYQLMPFSDYYDGEGADVYTPYVTFEDGVATQSLIDRYGYAVTPDELEDFLNGAEGRTGATYGDLANPINANAALLAEAIAMQSEIDSSWQPPAGIKVHQIAGVGEDTLAGIKYKTIQKCVSSTLGVCHERAPALSYDPVTVIDGDGTVVVPSALAMSESNSDVERWWVNLQSYNGLTPSLFRKKHGNILEINELRNFVFDNLIFDTASNLPAFIDENSPSFEKGNRLQFTLHSPLQLSAIDDEGNVVNEKEVSIPGASYVRYGEVQVLSLPTDTEFTLNLTGEAEGSFTLEMEEQQGDEIVASSTFSAIPSSTSTTASMNFTGGELETADTLRVDYDGDTIVDLSYTPVIGQTVVTPDTKVAEVEIKTSSGGRSKPKAQVLGESTSIEDLAAELQRIQALTVILVSLKGHISEEQYSQIEMRLKLLLVTFIERLKEAGYYN